MSGHSKFSNIKHRKGKNDAVRGKVFTKIGREIAVCVKEGGSDPAANSRLRDVIAKARRSNMPSDTIERSIKKAAGEAGSVSYEAITYEGYGPSGVAVIVEALTDNKNRTAANVRNAFTKGAGNMGTTGCVSFMFDEKGRIMIEDEDGDIDEDALMMEALEAGADDVVSEEGGFIVFTSPANFSAVREALESGSYPIVSAEIEMVPQTETELKNPDDIKKMQKLLDLLDDEDDVQNVYTNWSGAED